MSVSGFTQGSPSTIASAISSDSASSHQPETKVLKTAAAGGDDASVKALNDSTDSDLVVDTAVPNVSSA